MRALFGTIVMLFAVSCGDQAQNSLNFHEESEAFGSKFERDGQHNERAKDSDLLARWAGSYNGVLKGGPVNGSMNRCDMFKMKLDGTITQDGFMLDDVQISCRGISHSGEWSWRRLGNKFYDVRDIEFESPLGEVSRSRLKFKTSSENGTEYILSKESGERKLTVNFYDGTVVGYVISGRIVKL